MYNGCLFYRRIHFISASWTSAFLSTGLAGLRVESVVVYTLLSLYLMSMYLKGLHLMGLHLLGVYLSGVYLIRRAPH
jgi:hypothetical protein